MKKTEITPISFNNLYPLYCKVGNNTDLARMYQKSGNHSVFYGIAWDSFSDRCYFKKYTRIYRYTFGEPERYICDPKIEPVTKLLQSVVFINKQEWLDHLRVNKPYLYEFLADKNDTEVVITAMFPGYEILCKAGFKGFARTIVETVGKTNRYIGPGDIDALNRLVDISGTNPKTIFKCDKSLWSIIKTRGSLSIKFWDEVRKMLKFGRISSDAVLELLDSPNLLPYISNISSILRKTYRGRKVFTFGSLVNYLNRIDQYEAIEAKEGLQLLEDYLGCCDYLGMEPKVDGDSLKREHDVAARLCRHQRNEVLHKVLADRLQKYNDGRYNYQDKTFFIRAITSYDDLMDEATQQHNCLASYANRIANGTSKIFVMRRVESPNKSLVSVELSPECNHIRQKYLAYNQPIRDKEISDFLDTWLNQCKKISAEVA